MLRCAHEHDDDHSSDDDLRAALEARAQAQDKTVSEVAREILRQALMERSLASRAGHLKGKLDLEPDPQDSWRQQIERRNWRK